VAAESHMSAIHRIETIASMEDIDCDFQRVEGFLFLGGESTRNRGFRVIRWGKTALLSPTTVTISLRSSRYAKTDFENLHF